MTTNIQCSRCMSAVGALLISCRSDVLPIPSEDGGEPLAMEELQRSTLAVYLASLSHFEFSNSWVCHNLVCFLTCRCRDSFFSGRTDYFGTAEKEKAKVRGL